jgi:hypothetical protein
VTKNALTGVAANYLQWFDTSKEWSNSDSTIWNEITKPDNSTFNDAALFSDGTTLYFFGGAISLAPQALLVVPPEGHGSTILPKINSVSQASTDRRRYNEYT